MEKNLNFKQHIAAMCVKLSKSVGLFHRLKHYITQEFMKKLDYSLIQPYVNYGIEAWYGASLSATSGVHILQKEAIRAVFYLDYNGHTNQYLKKILYLNVMTCTKLIYAATSKKCSKVETSNISLKI